MSYVHRFLLFQPVTPLHVGCGHDVGVVDLPVIRERTTGHPFLPGSGTRGALRAAFETAAGTSGDEAAWLFGPRLADEGAAGAAGGDLHAGALAVHDAHLLLFPVRSDRGSFLWLTCPLALGRLRRTCGTLLDAPRPVPSTPPNGLPVPDDGEFLGPLALAAPGHDLHLEEIAFASMDDDSDEAAGGRAMLRGWVAKMASALDRPELAGRTVLVSDEAFHYFVTRATTVVQRNRLDAEKRVVPTGLFSLEALPPETVLWGLLGATSDRRPQSQEKPQADQGRKSAGDALARLRKVLFRAHEGSAAEEAVLHLGGEESVGLGVTRLVWVDGQAPEPQVTTAGKAP